jgi:hypothetical protein
LSTSGSKGRSRLVSGEAAREGRKAPDVRQLGRAEVDRLYPNKGKETF